MRLAMESTATVTGVPDMAVSGWLERERFPAFLPATVAAAPAWAALDASHVAMTSGRPREAAKAVVIALVTRDGRVVTPSAGR